MTTLLRSLSLFGLIFAALPLSAKDEPAVEATGTVFALSELDIRSPVAGKVEKISVQAGDSVKVGQLVAEIRSDAPNGPALVPIHSRMAGTVLAIPAQSGQQVQPHQIGQPGTTILTVGDLSRLNISVPIPAAVAATLTPQQAVQVYAPADARTPLAGKIEFIAPSAIIAVGEKVVPFQIYAPQPEPPVPPGSKVRILIPPARPPAAK